MRVWVIYGSESKIIRQIIVSDEIESLDAPKGCDVLEVPFEEYSKANDEAVRAFVAKEIGEPKHDGKCVEVDSEGIVVAAYLADPLIDLPLFAEKNTIEVNAKKAVIGDKKVDGVFLEKVAEVVDPIDTKPDPNYGNY